MAYRPTVYGYSRKLKEGNELDDAINVKMSYGKKPNKTTKEQRKEKKRKRKLKKY